MAITVNDKLTATWFTPSSERKGKAKNKAGFLISPLTGMQYVGISSLNDDELDKSGITTDYIKALLDGGIKDWRNINKVDGKPLKFEVDLIDILPAEILMELATEIMNRAAVNEKERKN